MLVARESAVLGNSCLYWDASKGDLVAPDIQAARRFQLVEKDAKWLAEGLTLKLNIFSMKSCCVLADNLSDKTLWSVKSATVPLFAICWGTVMGPIFRFLLIQQIAIPEQRARGWGYLRIQFGSFYGIF